MGHQAFAGLAVLAALAFMLMALSACANVEQTAHAASPSAVAAIPEEHAVPEFHGARIGRDTLRSRLPSEG